MRTVLSLLSPVIPVSLFLSALPLRAAEPEYWTAPFGPGGTWNLYQVESRRMTWTDAKAAAEVADPLSGSDKKGHLATISSAAENSFVTSIIGSRSHGYYHIGLTDSEDYGGKEAGSGPVEGWKWITGEALAWTGWGADQPDEWPDEGAGEDGVTLSTNAWWSDLGIGAGGQSGPHHSSIVEWDVALPELVKGARKLEPVLPSRWKVDFSAAAAKTPGVWKIWHTQRADNAIAVNLHRMAAWMDQQLTGPAPLGSEVLQFEVANRVQLYAGGWRGPVTEFPYKHLDNYGSLCSTELHLDAEQTWSFLIWVDDLAALRIPGVKWRAVHGQGYIDPLDPETMSRSILSVETWMIGVVTVPAGDHRLEVVMANIGGGGNFSLLAAPGEHSLPGATNQWRPVGWKPRGKLAWPGVTEAGWEVQVSAALGRQKGDFLLTEGAAQLENAEDKTTVVSVLNLCDIQSPGLPFFPDTKPFPDDPPDDQERFSMVATAILAIPADGDWHIGISSDAKGALQIEGVEWRGVLSMTGMAAKAGGDTIYCDNGKQFSAAGLVTLKKGEYPIRLLYTDALGPANVSVFGAPAGYPPRLLSAGGETSTEDVAGLGFSTDQKPAGK